MKNVPDDVWKCVYEKYCADAQFKKQIDEYWFPNNISFILPYQKLFLCYMNMLICQYENMINISPPSILYNDANFVLATIKYGGGALKELLHIPLRSSNTLIKNRYFLMKAIERGYDPETCVKLLNTDRELISMALRKSPKCVRYISEELKQDRELMFLAIQRDARAFASTSHELRSDITFIIDAIKINGFVFRFLDTSFKQNRQILLEAVQNKGCVLRYSDAKLRADRDIVRAAIRNNPEAFKFANRNFTADKEIMLMAIKAWPPLIRFIDSKLKHDPEIISEMRKKCRKIWIKDLYQRHPLNGILIKYSLGRKNIWWNVMIVDCS